jgi:phosphatidate cytidylyltransferase
MNMPDGSAVLVARLQQQPLADCPDRLAMPDNSLQARLAGFMTRELLVRIIAAVVLIPIVLLDVWLGDVWFDIGMALIAALMAAEWCRIVHGGSQRQFAVHGLAAIGSVLIVSRAGPVTAAQLIFLCWALSLAFQAYSRGLRSTWMWWGVPYIAFPGVALVMIRHSPDLGLTAVLWLFAVVWSADTLAYVFGRLIGGPKLAPAISPNKTWAGLAGAVVGGVAASVIAAWIAGLAGLAMLAFIGAILAVLEQAGDLFESAVKRRFGVKDSGKIIPGHGGVLDRVDGLMFAAVAAAAIGYLHAGSDKVASGLLVW